MKFQFTKSKKPYYLKKFGGEVMGHSYAVTNHYLTRDGKPYIYRMGEFHFSRVPRSDWEAELLKMKQGGIEIVASYLFWIHHEETEGVFDFSGNRDLGFFCETCRKVGMPFFLRLGPWAHGEARNGGFPDWLLEKCGGKEHTRVNEQPYLDCVRRFFVRVYEEIKEHMDVVIGIQVENELHRNAPHMETLCHMIEEIGFHAPIRTATGWGPAGRGAELPKGMLLPVYGGYPEAPWAAHIEPMLGYSTFHFSSDWNSADIGTDVLDADGSEDETVALDDQANPYLTCEIGGGNQVTYHRRPLLSSSDITSNVICRLGSGCNGVGYYMYHGGRNPIGKTTMQESRKSGYKNDYPIISYDFQAPIGDCGQLRQSYFELRSIHSFLEYFGELLAPMPSYLPDHAPKDLFDTNTLRCAVRSDGTRGFLFFNNHAHAENMKDITETVHVELADKNLPVSIPLTVPKNSYGIIPIRFPLGFEVAEWITAMPIFTDESKVIFEAFDGIKPQICLANGKIIDLQDGISIGGIKLGLCKKERRAEDVFGSIPLCRVSNKLSDAVFEHIENRDGSMIETVESVEYEFVLPPDTKTLVIDAMGNAAALFCGDALISDFYLYGDRWYVDVREISPFSTMTLKILPMTAENRRNVYLEIDMPIGVCEPSVYALKESDNEIQN